MSTKKELLEQNGILQIEVEGLQKILVVRDLEIKRLEYHINNKNQKLGKRRKEVNELKAIIKDKYPIQIWFLNTLDWIGEFIITNVNKVSKVLHSLIKR